MDAFGRSGRDQNILQNFDPTDLEQSIGLDKYPFDCTKELLGNYNNSRRKYLFPVMNFRVLLKDIYTCEGLSPTAW